MAINIKVKKKDIDAETIKIVKMLSEGYTIPVIAGEEGINFRTLEAKLLRIRTQFSCTNVAHLVAVFLRNKLIK